MKITSMEEYGLRCMLQLALVNTERPVSVAEIAENEGLSTEYAGKLLNMLRQAELVLSVRGRNGGFVLARPADEISLAQILRVFSPEFFDDEYCSRHAGAVDICVHDTACAIREVWWTLSRMITRTLESLSLTDLMCGEDEIEQDLRPQLEALGDSGQSGPQLIQIGGGAGPPR